MAAETEAEIGGLIESFLFYLENFMKHFRHYLALLEKFRELQEAEQKNRVDKAILILHQFGTKKDLEESINFAQNTTKQKASELRNPLDKIKKLIEKGSVECPKCKGDGLILKKEIIREKEGIRPYLRTVKCSYCYGKGQLHLSEEQKTHLRYVFKICDKTLVLVNSLVELSMKYLEILQLKVGYTEESTEIKRLKDEIKILREKIKKLEKSVPPIKKGQWNVIITFKGDTPTTTQSFFIPSKRWRVKWSYEPLDIKASKLLKQYIGEPFSVCICYENGKYAGMISGGYKSANDGVIYMHNGPGSFYFQITSAYYVKWALIVEAYVSS
ncbi:hypothetical protein J7K27_02300 [Candidatus Bathyarchaeota archaeon]|nr:hypothetical protein [Candidatus Bathyarchaeota archaeon]